MSDTPEIASGADGESPPPSPEVLHKDDPTRPGNLTAEQYAATYAEGEPHTIPADVLAAAIADAKERFPDD